MRRSGLLLVVLALAGCTALRDAFSAHPEAAGSAAGQTLTVERLGDLAGHAQRIPLRVDVLTGLAGVYLDYTVFVVELARGRDMDDSALVLATEWPTVSQMRWERFHERLVAARGKFSGAQMDSAYQAGTVRLFQHILIRVPANATPAVQQQQQQRAEGVLRRAAAQHGADFAALAKRFSDDAASKARGGYLPPTASRGQFVPAFDSAAWNLEPGAMSGVVRSPYGFHIIRRPPFSEVRDTFQTHIETARTMHFDSLYLDSLSTTHRLEVGSSAPALVRQAVSQMVTAREDERRLATYRGGAFRVKDLVHWLLALDPNDVRGVATASDAQLTQFVRILAQRDLLLRQVDSAGVALTPEDWRHVRADHDSAIAMLESLTGISPGLFKDSASDEQARIQRGMARLHDYLARSLTDGRPQFVPVPSFLAGALRRGEPWSLNAAGIARALERAQAVRAATDSGASARGAAPSSSPPSGLKPASGPPPVPSDSGTRTPR